MQPPSYDSSRWTRELEQAAGNGSRWTAGVGQPYVPPHLRRAGAHLLYDADQVQAMRHAALLMLSTIPLWLAGFVVQAATSDYLVEAPPLAGLWPVPLIGGFALWFVAEKGVLPKLCSWLGLVSWIAVIVAALTHAATGLYARSHAASGPQMRGQITRIDVTRRKHFTATTTTITLQDGTSLRTNASPAGDYGSMGRCLSARRVAGPFGFVWLRITDAAPLPPAPGPGQLAWPMEPVSRAECFSDKPLWELRATT